MDRRTFIRLTAISASGPLLSRFVLPRQAMAEEHIEKLVLSDAEWKKRLTPEIGRAHV